MNIAIIKDGECVNAAVFDDIATAQEFLSLGVWPDADSVAELPEGFGIGDSYVDGEWIKAEQPEPEPAPPGPPSIEQQITDLQIAVVEQFEENLALHEELTNTELAIVELFEMVIGGAKDG